jgi:5-methylcytosine-specific restriction endonuclease McrA
MKQQILKLNANYFPIGIVNWKEAMVDIVSGASYPIDIHYEKDNSGIDKAKISYMNVIKDFKEWSELPIREYDDYVLGAKSVYRLPSVIICSRYDKIIHKKVVFPTKNNIWRRDKFTCQYTGEKLSREDLSVDHILATSKGGQNTWENLVTCKKSLNTWKGNKTLKECGLKLLSKPEKPKNGLVFLMSREEWEVFL